MCAGPDTDSRATRAMACPNISMRCAGSVRARCTGAVSRRCASCSWISRLERQRMQGEAVRKIFVLVLGSLICCSAAATVNPGDMPPDDLGSTLAGQAIHTSALRGKVVVISLWATWCGYCLKELPTLAGLQSVTNQRGLPMQVVAVDYEEPRDVFRRTAKLLQPHLPGLLLTWDRNGAIR